MDVELLSDSVSGLFKFLSNKLFDVQESNVATLAVQGNHTKLQV